MSTSGRLFPTTGDIGHARRVTGADRRRAVRRGGSLCQCRRAARPFGPRRPRAPHGMEASLQTRVRHAGAAGYHRLPVGLEAFGEPAVDRSEKVVSLIPIALVAQPRARGGRVRYCSDSDRIAALRQLSVWANSGLMQCNKWARYSITLSARATNVGGTVMPIASAVLRLITSSNLVGCRTGRSAGLAPRKSLTSCWVNSSR